MPKFILAFIIFLVGEAVLAHSSVMPHILPLKERAAIMDKILEERFYTLPPQLMQEEGIDMWLIIAREYHEDPVMETIAARYLVVGPPPHHLADTSFTC